ncbi:hypothetical protein B0T24DRAFT_593546 [Lasiosphaeria ovina]|uniref:CBM-cenC domain-containing protein n=1 Tax=Lasiosphaeria ovina TaxID=92902 RepID=A0AAE0N785_9PEZI|nr:hypothetical protein B0T24DRAFT_593546 [Lasiosphaeria ovina]
MKSWTVCLGAGLLASVADAGCKIPTTCGSPKCFGALGADPTVGESFCSSWLSLAPVTTTVTELTTAVSTQVTVETTLTTLTTTTGTTTQTGVVGTTIFQKRVPSLSTSTMGPADAIISQCSTKEARISSACSCFLSTATASTVTVVETSISTALVESTSTAVSTVTSKAVATVSVAAPATTISANPVVNGGFETYSTTGNILPWSDTGATTGGRVQPLNGINPCTAGAAYCAGGTVAIRVYPPTTGGGYLGIVETFQARPSTAYSLSFMFRCLNFDTSSRIDVWYAGVEVGTVACPQTSSSAFYRATGIPFTTDSIGSGTLEIRFYNPSNLAYLYFYADDFQASHA